MKLLKNATIFYILFFIVILACNSKQNASLEKKNQSDSAFKYNYAVLDSIAKNNFFDTSVRCKNAIEFMEKTTGIKANGDGNYFGQMLFTRKDLEKWKEWLDNREK